MKISKDQMRWVLILHSRWRSMRKRCTPGTSRSKYHGDRGLRVCKQWDSDFEAFFEWSLTNGFDPSLTLERVENEEGYSPENCIWASYEVQNRNKRSTVTSEIAAGEMRWLALQGLSYSEIGHVYGVSAQVVAQIAYGNNWKSVKATRPDNWKHLLNTLKKRRQSKQIPAPTR